MDISQSLVQRFELNELSYGDDLMSLQSHIYQHPDTYLSTCSRWSFILRAYQQLCQGRLELDEFFIIGDIGSSIDHQAPALYMTGLFAVDTNNTPDASVYVCDSLQQQYFVGQAGNWDLFGQTLNDRDVKIFVL